MSTLSGGLLILFTFDFFDKGGRIDNLNAAINAAIR
jgi:hypothetical protein